MIDWKNVIGLTAVALAFVGYAPYLRDIVRKKTHPHLYSWVLWGFVTLLAFALQFSGGAGIGSMVTLSAALLCFVVIFLSFWSGAKRDIKPIDTVFFVMATVAVFIWLFAKQPVISIILVTIIDMLGFLPTVRKTWNDPHSETLSFYLITTFRFCLAIFALREYSILTALYPIAWTITDALFALMLWWRRKVVKA